jgi:hypothetical protein
MSSSLLISFAFLVDDMIAIQQTATRMVGRF